MRSHLRRWVVFKNVRPINLLGTVRAIHLSYRYLRHANENANCYQDCFEARFKHGVPSIRSFEHKKALRGHAAA